MDKIKFKDSIVIERSLTDSVISDAKSILKKDKTPSLKVTIDATHSGVLINRRVYPGKYVKEGYTDLVSKEDGGTAEFSKPILRHHDSHEDAIGRIVGAKYTQLKNGFDFEHDFLDPDPNGSKGSGVVTIDAIITDPDAIEKILDTRYLSVSAGHHSPVFLCSTCGDSLYECPHMPGYKYDIDGERDEDVGTVCYGITGKMFYDEVSFVNFPASPPAKLINHEWQDSKSDWNKNDTITTQINKKKEAVRNLSLCDSDGELSLLSGKHESSKPKKTAMSVSPAVADKLKHVLSSETPSKSDESSNDRPSVVDPNSGVLDEERTLDKAKHLETPTEENKMDADKLKELTDEISSLKDALETAKTQVTDLKAQVEAKDSNITRLTTDAEAMQTKMSGSLALSLATLRTRFNKLTPKKDGEEEFDLEKYVEGLSKRSVDSLQDSLQDLMADLDRQPETPEAPKVNGKTADEIVKDDQVADPTLSKGSKPTVTKKSVAKSSEDILNDGLGL